MNWFVLVLVVGLVLEIAETGSNVEDENEDEEEWVGSWKAALVERTMAGLFAEQQTRLNYSTP